MHYDVVSLDAPTYGFKARWHAARLGADYRCSRWFKRRPAFDCGADNNSGPDHDAGNRDDSGLDADSGDGSAGNHESCSGHRHTGAGYGNTYSGHCNPNPGYSNTKPGNGNAWCHHSNSGNDSHKSNSRDDAGEPSKHNAGNSSSSWRLLVADSGNIDSTQHHASNSSPEQYAWERASTGSLVAQFGKAKARFDGP
jgi:hypothetical protein